MEYLPQIAAVTLLLLWPVVALRVQRIRSLAYPKGIRCRVAGGAPSGYSDLYRAADEQLKAAGFSRFAWFELDWGPGFGPPRPFCVYRHPSDPTEVAVFLPEEPRPNLLRFTASTELTDGTVLQSFGNDPRSAAVSAGIHLRRNVPTDSVSELLAAHRSWLQELPADPVVPASDPSELASAVERSYAEMLRTLVEEGRLKPAKNGKHRPPLKLVSGLLKAEDRAPGPPADTGPVPLPRQLAMLAAAEAPAAIPASRRWGRFVLSALAFAAIGGLVWGWESAAALLGVVAFHELGHFLAMRRFGYRHVRIVLIPLLGGVATGVESDPSGSRRAVVSLAGPVPGIVLGWALLALYVRLLADGSLTPANRSLSTAAFALLGLNYLNLLPIPPLDGGRVLESLIPKNWVAVERAVTGLAAVGGLLLAWRLNFPLLALLVVWQLAGQRRQWDDRRLADRLSDELGEEGLRCPKVDLHVLKALAAEGPREGASSRVERARAIRNLLTVRPPGRGARLAIVAVYLAAFGLPFVLVPQAAERLSSQVGLGRPDSAAQTGDRFRRYEAEATQRPTNELLAAVAVSNSYRTLLQCGVPQGSGTGTPQPSPAEAGFDEASLDEAENRLGVSLPEEYRQTVLLPPAPAANLRPPNELVLAGSAGQDLPFDRDGGAVDLSYATDSGEISGSPVPVVALFKTVVISSRLREIVLLKVGRDPALECCRVLVGDLEGGLIGYHSVRAWLEAIYPAARENARLAGDLVERNREAFEQTSGLDVAGLVDLTIANVKSYPEEAWEDLDRSPVDDQDLAELDRRIEITLPDDYRAFLRASNGLPQLELLPASAVRRATPEDWPTGFRGERRIRLVAPDGRVDGDFAYPEGARERSVVIASLPPVKGVSFDPSAVLVPDAGGWRYVNLQSNCAYPSFEHYLRAEYARQRTYDTGPSRPALGP